MNSVVGCINRLAIILLAALCLGCTQESDENEGAASVDESTRAAARVAAAPDAVAMTLEQPANRREAEAQLETTKAAFDTEESDVNRRAYAQALFRVGDIWDAANIVEPLATVDSSVVVDLLVGAKSALYLFDLARAEQLYDRLLTLVEAGTEDHKEVIQGLMMVYYQTQQFQKADKLPKLEDETADDESLITMMQRFEGVPYQIEWTTADKTGHIPFINDIREPGVLPISNITINGETFEFLLDTGGDRLYLDETFVEKSRVKMIGKTQHEYAYTGGETVDEAYAVADKVEFDGVIIRNVPVHVAPLKARGIEADGIITTGLLKQFLSTVDYDNNEITLRERSTEARNELMAAMSSEGVIGMPFIMTATHLMFAKGTVNDRTNMNMFMDSGLALSMPGVVSNETVALFDLDKTDIEGTDYYWVSLDQFGLNHVAHGPGNAVGNIFVEEDIYWRLGFAFDALLSHQYLWPLGSWTIDFDEMAFYFPGKAAHAEPVATEDGSEKVKVTVGNTEPYVGSYAVAPGVNLEITAIEGVVYLRAPGQQAIGMEAYDDGTFGIPVAGATIEFEGDPTTGITGLVMTQGANVTRAKRQ